MTRREVLRGLPFFGFRHRHSRAGRVTADGSLPRADHEQHHRTTFTGASFAVATLALTLTAGAHQASFTITGVVASADGNALLIYGSNMCTAPSVTLGGKPQAVTSADADLVTIAYPPVAAGSYRLIVSCGVQPGRPAAFSVEIRRRRS